MISTIRRLLEAINTRLSQNSNNKNLILLKLRLLRQYPELTMRDRDEFKRLDFTPLVNGCSSHFYHAWARFNDFYQFHTDIQSEYYNFHVSLIGNRFVKTCNISTTYYEMNPNFFSYIGVVFGSEISIKKNDLCSKNERNASFIRHIRHIQTMYSHWFHFPEAEDPFITKSLVGIEEACPICGGDEDLDKCVMVRGGCGHAFHRKCLELWFFQCKDNICPSCRMKHNKTG